ncbi:hypothetical protein LFL97_38810 (plasmid) [Burkholderia sp. JSH-S8]|nr:hypothetical protein LFL97_38810 [Burkholderia sp. JSH-S8]
MTDHSNLSSDFVGRGAAADDPGRYSVRSGGTDHALPDEAGTSSREASLLLGEKSEKPCQVRIDGRVPDDVTMVIGTLLIERYPIDWILSRFSFSGE